MKRNLLLFVSLFVTMFSYGQARIYVAVTSPDEPMRTELHYFEDIFHSELSAIGYKVRIVTPSSDDVFSKERNRELYDKLISNDINSSQAREFGEMLEVDRLCVIVVEKTSETAGYYFRAKIFDTATGELAHSASYPEPYLYPETDSDVINDLTNRPILMRAGRYLVSRLKLLDADRQKDYDIKLHQADTAMINRNTRQTAQANRQHRHETMTKNLSNFIKPYFAWYFELGGNSIGFQTGMGLDLKYITIGGGVILGGETSKFHIKNDEIGQGINGGKIRLQEASPYVYGGLNFKYFGIGIKPIFYSFRDPNKDSHPNSAEVEIYEYMIQNHSRTVIGLTPCVRVHFPLGNWNDFRLGNKLSGACGVSATIGYTILPSYIGYNSGIDFSIGLCVFW